MDPWRYPPPPRMFNTPPPPPPPFLFNRPPPPSMYPHGPPPAPFFRGPPPPWIPAPEPPRQEIDEISTIVANWEAEFSQEIESRRRITEDKKHVSIPDFREKMAKWQELLEGPSSTDTVSLLIP